MRRPPKRPPPRFIPHHPAGQLSQDKTQMDLLTEQGYFSRGIALLGGLDEAGRGPLAGPVVAACVVLPAGFAVGRELADVKDSKKLSEQARERLYAAIMAAAGEVGVGLCSAETIDRINILEASLLAMKMAIGALKRKPEQILIDGNQLLRNYSGAQAAIPRGDSRVFSIAAASIIAKVERDRIMRALDRRYPAYGFAGHKGYGTARHLAALRAHGPSPAHRRTFARVLPAPGISSIIKPYG